ncbi:MAG TPA: hypothetical protein VGR28_06215 [Candidatus Thermoplasmatota archaeon]|jgi:hypothetical protein|nr:hypothetical protein [Candidatus Thermoplasmatota archaeon]
MSRASLLLLAAGLALPALPALAADYTDHFGTWAFHAPPPADVAMAPEIRSVLLTLNDGTGFTAFVEPVPQGLPPPFAGRPPTMAFECYPDLGEGRLFVRGMATEVTGTCALTVEDIGGLHYVVRFAGHEAPIAGTGIYNLRPAG